MRMLIFKCVLLWIILLSLAIFWGHSLRSSKTESRCQQSIERDCDGNQKVIRYEDLPKENVTRANTLSRDDTLSAEWEPHTVSTTGYPVMGIRTDGDYGMLQLDNQGILYVKIAPDNPNAMPVRVVP